MGTIVEFLSCTTHYSELVFILDNNTLALLVRHTYEQPEQRCSQELLEVFPLIVPQLRDICLLETKTKICEVFALGYPR